MEQEEEEVVLVMLETEHDQEMCSTDQRLQTKIFMK